MPIPFAESGQNERLEDQLPLPAEPLLLRDELRIGFQSFAGTIDRGFQVIQRQRRVRPLPPLGFALGQFDRGVDVFCFLVRPKPTELGERTPTSNAQQLDQLPFGHRPPLASRVRRRVQLRHVVDRIHQEPFVANAPVREDDQFVAKLVDVRGRHSIRQPISHPTVERL